MTDRKRFLHELGAELDAIDSQLDQYRTEFRNETSAGPKEPLGTLEKRREQIRRRSRELEDFDGDEWEAARRDIETQRDELKRSLARVRDDMRH